jgi:PAS domain S-box/diguanylate cyclase (GGDEF) domain
LLSWVSFVNKHKPQSGRNSDLRARAERRAGKKQTHGVQLITDSEELRLLHELQVHQIELEMQNDELRRAQLEAEALRNKYHDLYDFAPVAYFTLDERRRILETNLAGAMLLEVERDSLIKQHFAQFVELNARTEFNAFFKRVLKTGTKQQCELGLVKNDASPVYALVEGSAAPDSEGQAKHARIAVVDITERKQAVMALSKAHDELAQANEDLHGEKEFLRVTLASIGDAVITTDVGGRITYLNPVAERYTGWTNRQARDVPLSQVLHIEDEVTREAVEDPVVRCLREDQIVGLAPNSLLVRRDGEAALAIDDSAAPIRDSAGHTIGAVLIFRDVTEQRRLTRQVAHQATHDALTGLVNRHEFERRLKRLLDSASLHSPHALLYLDLDQFKVVNDTVGHTAGDELLRQVTALLQSRLRARDTLARLGGDEFGVLLEHCPSEEALRIANDLRRLVQDLRFAWQDKRFAIGVSIGMLAVTQQGDSLERVLSAVDSACYAAKEKGRNRVHIYRADDSAQGPRHGEMQWVPRIQQALAEGRFRLYYQPIVPIGPNSEEGGYSEILLRLLDEQGQLILPGAFIPPAERYDQMLSIDCWVACNAFEALGACTTAHPPPYAINISGQSLGDGEFLNFVIEQLDRSGVPPSSLCFEITETAAIADLTHALRFISTLKARGCRFALDDFGSGLASFSYLKTLPVDYLKIDGCFVMNMAQDPIDRTMVSAINQIGHVMGIKTIAESVENEKTLRLLKDIGVDYAQGYGIAKPRPMVEG